MIEKVNPSHPDKLADRIAGAIVDLAYMEEESPKCAVEVLLGHGKCLVIIESSVQFTQSHIKPIVSRIAGDVELELISCNQDKHLSDNQRDGMRCGDNGIFRGVPLSGEEKELSEVARRIYERFSSDGKYIKDGKKLVICQSNAKSEKLQELYPNAIVNPLGDWTGGINVDCGATNRKLGSDMAGSVTGGGLHGKDLSKADVSVNIYAFLKAQETSEVIEMSCAIGDDNINGISYDEIVSVARNFISSVGGFEKFAEWGLF